MYTNSLRNKGDYNILQIPSEEFTDSERFENMTHLSYIRGPMLDITCLWCVESRVGDPS